MALNTLDPKTALVVVDLQKGFVRYRPCTRSMKSSTIALHWRTRSATHSSRSCW